MEKYKTHCANGMNRVAAHNRRFGAMAAVAPQTILCEIERYYPAGSSVEAPPASSRWTLHASEGQQCDEIFEMKIE